MAEGDDEYIVAKAAAGGPGAFDPLFARWNGRFRRHAWRLIGEEELARDAVQEAWAEIARGLPALRERAAFPAWAYRIVTRRCAKMVRRLQTQRRTDAALEAQPGDAPEEMVAAERRLDSRAVAVALARLPKEQRAAIDLFYLDGLSVAEIAVALDAPIGTVKTRLMHARRKLRADIEGDDR
jgi:RNA polymerase sigma factor (sigma-70 family)